MSVNLMSAIFEVEFFDLQDEEGNTTKASTAKLVLLAMADHANDEGEGAYPSVERLARKTALSEQTIRNTFGALRHNGIISLEGKSKYGTNNHTINTFCFPRAKEKEVTYLTLKPVAPQTGEVIGSNRSHELNVPVIPESSLITQEPSLLDASLASQTPGKWKKLTEKTQQDRREILKTAERIEGELGLRPDLKDTKWKRAVRAIMEFEKNGQPLSKFAEWLKSGNDYNRPKTFQMAKDPTLIISNWPQAFQNEKSNFLPVQNDDNDSPMSW